MSDPDEREPAFDDPAFDEIRGLLADARVTEPIPADVAARLDATLASLRPGAGDDTLAPVVPLRRRLAPRLLVAAAAVVVIGAGGVGIAQLTGGSGGSSNSADSGAAAGRSSTLDSTGSGTTAGPASPTERAPMAAAKAAPELTTARFAQDAARLMRSVAEGSVAAAVPSAAPQDSTGTSGTLDLSGGSGDLPDAPPVTATPEQLTNQDAIQQSCPGPAPEGAVTLTAVLDGSPVALVFRSPTASGQRVEAWSCDGARLLASATVAH